jgi:hypothetical protein
MRLLAVMNLLIRRLFQAGDRADLWKNIMFKSRAVSQYVISQHCVPAFPLMSALDHKRTSRSMQEGLWRMSLASDNNNAELLFSNTARPFDLMARQG